MMKKQSIAFLFCLLTGVCFGQRRTTLIMDSISVTYSIARDSSGIREDIELENSSSSTFVSIPAIKDKTNSFFVLGNTLYSNFGLMSSRLGYPNLSLDVELIEVRPKERFAYSVTIPIEKTAFVNDYFFSFDYIDKRTLVKLNKSKQNASIRTINYVKGHRYGIVRVKE